MNEKRLFSQKQKKYLYLLSDGKCQICDTALKKGWHADHVTPHSKGGETKLRNGQALCPNCNLKKSDTMNNQKQYPQKNEKGLYVKSQFPYKLWLPQKNGINAAMTRFLNGDKTCLLDLSVGLGKTITSLEFAHKLYCDYDFDFVLIVAPWLPVIKGFYKDAKKNFNFELKTDSQIKSFDGFHGLAVTPRHLTNRANLELINHYRKDKKCLLIVDETHHNGDDMKFGQAVNYLIESFDFSLFLTGTPYRTDSSKIVGLNYEEQETGNFVAKPDYSFSHGMAVKGKFNRPTKFYTYGGEIKYTLEGDYEDYYSEVEDAETDKERANVFKSILRGESNFVKDLISESQKVLTSLRRSPIRFNKKPAGLILAKNTKQANYIKRNLLPNAEIVHSRLSENPDIKKQEKAWKVIEDFVESDVEWIIAVGMISEGTNIPRLQVVVYLTNTVNGFFPDQVLGRAVRVVNDAYFIEPIFNEQGEMVANGKRYQNFCHFFMPAVKPLLEWAHSIMEEQIHVIESEDDEDDTRGGNVDVDIDPIDLPPAYIPLDEKARDIGIIEGEKMLDSEKAKRLKDALIREGYPNVPLYPILEALENPNVMTVVDEEPLEEKIVALRKENSKHISRLAGIHVSQGKVRYGKKLFEDLNDHFNELVRNKFKLLNTSKVENMSMQHLDFRLKLISTQINRHGGYGK